MVRVSETEIKRVRHHNIRVTKLVVPYVSWWFGSGGLCVLWCRLKRWRGKRVNWEEQWGREWSFLTLTKPWLYPLFIFWLDALLWLARFMRSLSGVLDGRDVDFGDWCSRSHFSFLEEYDRISLVIYKYYLFTKLWMGLTRRPKTSL